MIYLPQYEERPNPLLIAVVGGRNFKDYDRMERELDADLLLLGPFTVVTGGAGAIALKKFEETNPSEFKESADALAIRWAYERGMDYQIIWPNYDEFPAQVAPLERNTLIAERCHAGIAYHDGWSKGTKDVIEKIRRAAKEIIIRPFAK